MANATDTKAPANFTEAECLTTIAALSAAQKIIHRQIKAEQERGREDIAAQLRKYIDLQEAIIRKIRSTS